MFFFQPKIKKNMHWGADVCATHYENVCRGADENLRTLKVRIFFNLFMPLEIIF